MFIIFIGLAFAIVGWVHVLTVSLQKSKPNSRVTNTPAPSISSNSVPFIESKEGNIRVSEPKAGATLHIPFTIKGEGRVFENVISLRIENQNKDVMYQGFITALSPDIGEFGPFEVTIDNQENKVQYLDKTTSGNIYVFENSAKDGSEVNVVKVPFTLAK